MAVLILHNSCAIYLSPRCVGGVGIWLTVPVRVRIVSWKKHILLPLLVCPGRQCGVRLLFKSLYRLALSMKVGLKGLKARTRLSRLHEGMGYRGEAPAASGDDEGSRC